MSISIGHDDEMNSITPSSLPGFMRSALNPEDVIRLEHMIELLSASDPVSIVATVVSDLAETLVSRCELDHVGLLVFPEHHADLLSAMDERGFSCGEIVPSTIVRERIRVRHELVIAPEVVIVHATTAILDGSTRKLEIFMAPSALTDAADLERFEGLENHIAIVPKEHEDTAVREVCALLLDGGLVSDGGGFNPHVNQTVLYFCRPDRSGNISRLELTFPAHYPEILARHLK